MIKIINQMAALNNYKILWIKQIIVIKTITIKIKSIWMSSTLTYQNKILQIL